MQIILLKCIILISMFIVTFIFSLLPVFFVNHIHKTHDSTRRSRYHHILSFMSCFAGGVFMGTCILDLFPDVQKQINFFMSQYSASRPFPLPEFIVVFGFLVILSMEQIVLDSKERSLEKKISSERQSLLGNSETMRRSWRMEHSISGVTDAPDLTASMRMANSALKHENQSDSSGEAARSCDRTDGHEHTDIFDHSIHHDVASHSALRSFLLLFALSLHSIFEGMAVGLQDTIDNLLTLFIVVIFHKGTLALSLSINMVQSRLTIKQIVLSNLFFCVTAPIGIAVGIGVNELKNSLTTLAISGSLQGIACGTFLYVTFFEVLPHEMNNGENRLLKLLCILIGFSFICVVLYVSAEKEVYHCYSD